jgi:hypothetical protein
MKSFDFDDPSFITRMELMEERTKYVEEHQAMMLELHKLWQLALKHDYVYEMWQNVIEHLEQSIKFVSENERLSPSHEKIQEQYNTLLIVAKGRIQ